MTSPATPPEASEGRPTPPPDPGRRSPGRPVAARRNGTAALALTVAWFALLGVGYLGWRQWQGAQATAGVAALAPRVATLETSVRSLGAERAALERRVAQLEASDLATKGQVPGLLARTRHLEDAVATLAERTRTGRDPMLLDETESLLRMGAERYRLFHDATGARAALELADQTLAAVDDGAYAAVRQAIRVERDALAKNAAGNRDGMLETLQDLRGGIPDLPLRPEEAPPAAASSGMWTRLGRALTGVIHVQRDVGEPLAAGDARLTRELVMLDLAQAQAALLAYDGVSCVAALRRADAGITHGFDPAAPAVKQALTSLRQLATRVPTGAPVRLGAALAELRSLRAVHALAPDGGAASAPARPNGTPGKPVPRAGGARP